MTKPLILQRFQTLQNSIRQQIITMLSQMPKKFIKISRSDILIYRNAYAIMPVGKKDMTMFHVNKERAPGCTANTLEGSSLFISVVERPLGYLLSLSCLSNHLQMRWQVTPAATATKKDITISMCSPPPVAGSRLDNMISIAWVRTNWNMYK